jgi:hypothetical protein
MPKVVFPSTTASDQRGLGPREDPRALCPETIVTFPPDPSPSE